MDSKYWMNNTGWLKRRKGAVARTEISAGLRRKMLVEAIERSVVFYSDFLGVPSNGLNYEAMADDYALQHAHAVGLELFKAGGIEDKDHLSLWCLSHLFRPQMYVESGVYIGSSLHAFIGSPSLETAVAIDPNIAQLRVTKKDMPGLMKISDRDFSQVDLDTAGKRCIAYFDDHIDAAARILQARERGIRYVLFDDATGLEGVCQRIYPAIPTIPMIRHHERYAAGDQLTWTYRHGGLRGLIKSSEVCRLDITQELLDHCAAANEAIAKCQPIPDLGEFLPQPYPGPMIDTTKYILELRV